ncbi:MAG: heme o synthase [Nitrososphaerota archaeon]|nr:heme o synthase [Nitrososphaerota archaeon]MDG7023316.1 heme o synthase [Nitrososphaerota archaeon]
MTARGVLGDYWSLTKPRIWGLLVFTGVVAMLVAFKETPGASLTPALFATGTIALVLGSAGAEVLTNYHDRDIDSMMKRTMKRALPSGRIRPSSALVFGLAMAALSVLVPLFLINSLSAGFMLVGLIDNIVVYSLITKRKSWLNIILGGVSGGMPVLVGYTAVAGAVSPIAVYMSALVIVWIPTHIWSLAIFNRKDYETARVPMLPIVFGDRVASICVAGTSALLAVFSVAIFLFTPNVSIFYTLTALVLGGVVLAYSAKLALTQSNRTAWTLFKLTSPYLTVIFFVLGLTVWVAA